MINRILFLLVAILLLGSHSVMVARETDDLQLTTSISNLSYCSNTIYENEFDVFIKLRLTYTNTGLKPIILEKEPNLITYWRAKPNLKELESADYTHEFWMSSDNEGVTEIGNVPSANFVVLQSGESYRSEADIQISSAKDLIERKVITTGAQHLQIVIPKWSGDEKQARFLKDKWKKVGVLYYGSVHSQPMLFTIESQPRIVECSHAT